MEKMFSSKNPDKFNENPFKYFVSNIILEMLTIACCRPLQSNARSTHNLNALIICIAYRSNCDYLKKLYLVNVQYVACKL